LYYFHISFSSPFGFGTFFYKGKEHPLMPEVYKDRTKKLADDVYYQTKQLIRPEAIVFIGLHELPLEVAKAKWPEDFKEG
jgi:hypothetical protein